jgi:hypothetical protein
VHPNSSGKLHLGKCWGKWTFDENMRIRISC